MRLGIFGAPPDTPNMGVTALFDSIVVSLDHVLGENLELVVFDNRLGLRRRSLPVPGGTRSVPAQFFGARVGRAYWRHENLRFMRLASSLGSAGGVINKGVGLIDGCDAVLDISAGDSFSDIYGLTRFRSVVDPKHLAIDRGVPLVLMPQTYGPFKTPALRAEAREVLAGARLAWARDPESYEILKDLLGDEFDPLKHRCGYDMAFVLPATDPGPALPQNIAAALHARDSGGPPIVGINVSGLIANGADSQRKFGFRADYAQVLHDFVAWILNDTGATVIFVPHVLSEVGHYESDLQACLALEARFVPQYRDRVAIVPTTFTDTELKWLISKTNWFCGTRMHSTIASLSTTVPCAALVYSDKAKGVFDSCGVGNCVVDPRKLDTRSVVAALQQCFLDRDDTARRLAETVPPIKTAVFDQARDIVDHIRAKP